MTFPTVIAPILQAATLAALWHDAAAITKVLAVTKGPLGLPEGQRPVRIDVGIYLDDFFGIDIESNNFKVDFWLSLRWNDPRNAFNLSDPGSPPEPLVVSTGNQEDTELWLPDLAMTNSHPGFEPTLSNLLTYPNGTVVWMRRMVLEFEANAQFSQFPFDWHSLEMKLESKAYYSSDIALQPWFHMAGHKSEKTSAGSYIWNLLQFDPPRSSCGDLCADAVCSATCEETASDEKQTLIMSQYIKNSFSGAPDGSMLGSAMFKKYRLVATLKVDRVLGNLVLSYFLPSTLLMMITMLSFLPDCSDLGTRLGASLVGLLTFEVMAERVDGKIPAMERITWITVWHVFHVLLLTSIVLENGLASYYAVHTYRMVARTIDRFSIVLFALWYLLGVFIMLLNKAAEKMTSLLTGIIALVVLGELLVLGFAGVARRATDRIILSRLVGSSQLRGGRDITWAVVDRIVSWRQRDGHRDRSWRCCRRALVHTGFRLDGLSLPDSALQGLAFERIARRAQYTDEPMAAVLSEDEFIRGLWKSFGRCLPKSSSGTSNELSQAARNELKGRSVIFVSDGSDGGTDRPIGFQDSNLLKLIVTATGASTSI
mmetsp:Transcript_66805/g.206860  ORF Transcript_66805/g.206860 Transcript_66805/m.206860 type:complete len:598 (+) Transcript_66805:3-1796(+)